MEGKKDFVTGISAEFCPLQGEQALNNDKHKSNSSISAA